MRRVYKAIVAAAIMAAASEASAEFFDGNKLLSICTKPQDESLHWADCLGYITGVADALHTVTICMPRNAQRGQVRDIVIKYMIDYPERRAQSGDQVVQEALGKVWPCAERSQQPRRQAPSTLF